MAWRSASSSRVRWLPISSGLIQRIAPPPVSLALNIATEALRRASEPLLKAMSLVATPMLADGYRAWSSSWIGAEIAL